MSESQELPEVIIPAPSRLAGQKADASSRRSIAIADTSHEQRLRTGEETHAVVDYFYHADRFWRAVIPLDAVKQIYGQAFNFSKPRQRKGPDGPETVVGRDGLPKRSIRWLNHVQTRFELHADRPAKLYPLGADLTGEAEHAITDFVYSIEAVGPPGVLFNLRDAMRGSLLSAHRVYSMSEMVFERIVVENQYVLEGPPLPLSDDDRRELLVESLLRSHRAGNREFYYMYRPCRTNNCTSNPFQLLDKVVEYRWPYRLGAMLYRLPLRPRFYLRVRGLDADPSFRKLVREEYAEFIANAETQKRKRAYVRREIQTRRQGRAEQSRRENT